ncbi:MAG TPA: lamin tail domain-containing protein [Chitinophagales bacterium]|nr:lamin tail domain-containing protein [Chitinophagales bacterium]HNE45354.1 lamin tail domain-containing protein [Chitinophagales bacterium]HNF67953.1 lamin tail domain-containing protein [Chitinophagales bacterium]HNJ87983.1 lamin tail domain-containing protein [Chitinophagales bacterium]HNM07371.1 lamin tail domain-containing protein [Chitinophagales bacterium]
MKSIYTLCLVMLACAVGQAQSFFDDFNDADISDWGGTPEYFIANGTGELQLNGDCAAGGDHYISQALPTLDSAVWSFQVHLDFDPSNSNHTRVFLQSDIADLSGDVYGYFVRVGEDGTGDVVKLWRSNGASASVVITGTSPVAFSPVVGVKVVRTADAEWQLYVDADGGTDYVLEGTDIDDTYNGGNYAGIECRYTSTRCTLFYFDDFSIDPLYIDVTAPAIQSVTVLSSTQLLVDFTENITLVTAETESNYTVTGGVGSPIDATRDVIDNSKVTLTFLSEFPEGITLTLAVNGVTDDAGNITSGATANFSVYTTQLYDIVINELMADPSPPVALPEDEFLELYNTTDVDIDITGFTLSDASGPSDPFTSYILPAHGYVILCDDGDISSFLAYSNVLPVAGFPSLNNDGDDMMLSDQNGIEIHRVTYTSDWYQNAIKADGGWTLEMIDPANPCQGIENWIASDAVEGGTPGAQNSVFGSNPDLVAPALLEVFPQTLDTLTLTFSEAVIGENIITADIQITDETGASIAIAAIILNPDNDAKIGVVLSSPLSGGVIYTCTVMHAADCSGNDILLFNTITFGIPEPVSAGDIVINEILFNPVTNGVDYVELYNRSNKIIDLSTLIIAELELLDSTVIDEFAYVTSDGQLLFPGNYICVTSDIEQVLAQYFTVDTGNFVKNNNLPGYNDNEGIVVLYDATLNEIDHLHYFDDWHYALLDDENGVSLERVNYAFATQDENNWHSAASDVHYGTPGYQNSMFGEIHAQATIGVEYPVFTPDGDGYHDLLVITYLTESEGFTGAFTLFDAQGRKIKTLTTNELLSREGFITWDGVTDDGSKANSGIYIIYAELFNTEGVVERFKLKCTLLRKQ